MNIGEHYIVTGNSTDTKHNYAPGKVVKIVAVVELGYVCEDFNENWQILKAVHLLKAHQIYENGELKWVGPHYIMPCERGNTIEEKTYERPSDFKIDDGVVIFQEPNPTIGYQTQFTPIIFNYIQGELLQKEIQVGDSVDITSYGESRIPGKVLIIRDGEYWVEFRSLKRWFNRNELVKI